MKRIKVTIKNYGPRIEIWPAAHSQAQLVSWLFLHRGRWDATTKWRTQYSKQYGLTMMPYIVVSLYDSLLPKALDKRLKTLEIQRFSAMLPICTITDLLGDVRWEDALAARDNAKKLPVTYTGEFYIVGEGADARHYQYRSQLDYVLAPQSILSPWDAILRKGEAWFYFGEA